MLLMHTGPKGRRGCISLSQLCLYLILVVVVELKLLFVFVVLCSLEELMN